jgi:hypothetical protein
VEKGGNAEAGGQCPRQAQERDRGTDLPHGWEMRGRVGGEGREC